MRHLPADARVYINLYDLKRVYGELQDTRFYDVLAHWFDTGMSDSDQRANPLMGGMVEKTVLDTVGNEFGIALIPSVQRGVDFVAVAKIESGSGFILKLALASAKKTRKIEFAGGSIYGFPTKDSRYQEIFVYLGDDLAFASSDLDRIKQAGGAEGTGPKFLRKLGVDAIPQDTFLFAQSDNPSLSAIGYGTGHDYRLRMNGDATIVSHLPESKQSGQTVFQLQTNGTEIFNQPATSFSLESEGGDPISHLLLTFDQQDKAELYSQTLLEQLNAHSGTIIETFNRRGLDCYHYRKSNRERFLCSGQGSILLAEGQLDLQNTGFQLKGNAPEKLPLTVRMQFRRELISDYFHRIENKEWSRFDRAKQFYFLSCLQELSGSIDRSNREISARFN